MKRHFLSALVALSLCFFIGACKRPDPPNKQSSKKDSTSVNKEAKTSNEAEGMEEGASDSQAIGESPAGLSGSLSTSAALSSSKPVAVALSPKLKDILAKNPPHDSLFMEAAKVWKDRPPFGYCQAPLGTVRSEPQLLLYNMEDKKDYLLASARLTLHCYLEHSPTVLRPEPKLEFLHSKKYDLHFKLQSRGKAGWTAKVLGPAPPPRAKQEIRP